MRSVLVIWVLLLASIVNAQGSSSATLYAGQTGNSVSVTITNESDETTLTGVRVYAPNAGTLLTIESITPATAILEPGRADTFTVLFSIRDDATSGASEAVVLNVSADQEVAFDFPTPTLEVSIGDSGMAQILAELERRVRALERLREDFLRQQERAADQVGFAQGAAEIVDLALAKMTDVQNLIAQAETLCGEVPEMNAAVATQAERVEKSEALVDAAIRGATTIASNCASEVSAGRIEELYEKAEEITARMGAEVTLIRADADRVRSKLEEYRRALSAKSEAALLVDQAQAGAADAQAAFEATGDAVAAAETIRGRIESEGGLLRNEIERVRSEQPGNDPALDGLKERVRIVLDAPMDDASARIVEAQNYATRAQARAAEAEGQAAALGEAAGCGELADAGGSVSRAENAYTGALIHLGAGGGLRAQAAECVARAEGQDPNTAQRWPGEPEGDPQPQPDAEPDTSADTELDDFIENTVSGAGGEIDRASDRAEDAAVDNSDRVRDTASSINSVADSYNPTPTMEVDDFIQAVENDRIRRGDPSIHAPTPDPDATIFGIPALHPAPQASPPPESQVSPDATIFGIPTRGSTPTPQPSTAAPQDKGPMCPDLCNSQVNCVKKHELNDLSGKDRSDAVAGMEKYRRMCLGRCPPGARTTPHTVASCVKECRTHERDKSAAYCNCYCQIYR